MAGIKETPRQVFINIAYIIVLGLLFLSTPESVLNSFKKMRDTFDQARVTEKNNTKLLFETFEKTKLKEEPTRALPIYERAKSASKIASEVEVYLEDLTSVLVNEGGGLNPKDGDIYKKENTDISPRIMIKQGKAKQLKAMLSATEQKLKMLLDSADKSKFNSLSLAQATNKNWEEDTFGEGIPLTASLTNLARIHTNIVSIEGNIVKSILGNMDKAVVNLDQFNAVAVAPSSYIIQGQPYKAEVFLTASDSKSNPVIIANGSQLAVSNGKGMYSVSSSSEGIHKWSAVIQLKQTDGSIKEYRTPEQQYQVARPSAVVNAKKMNVLYIGVENPVAISAPGIAKEKVRATISSGTIQGRNGDYTVTVNAPGGATINVYAEVAPGKSQLVSSSEFRVKRIPDPRAKFGGKTGGMLPTVAIKSQDKIFAALEGFDFDAKFSITRFSLIIMKPGDNASVTHTTGNTLSSQMKSLISNITPNTRVIFDNIQAIGPDQQIHSLDPIVLTAN